jgi:ketosteroid isomerase-like protein
MDQADLDVLCGSYEALNDGDMEGCLAALAPDAVWRESSELPGANEAHGIEAIRGFLTDFMEQWTKFHQEIEETHVVGDRVALLIRLEAVGRGSGIQVDTRYAHVWTVREGQGVAVDAYRDQGEALRALRAGPEARAP